MPTALDRCAFQNEGTTEQLYRNTSRRLEHDPLPCLEILNDQFVQDESYTRNWNLTLRACCCRIG